jgi:hypothetical protein
MLDRGVDLPHRCVAGTGLDVVRGTDCLFLMLDAAPLLGRTQLPVHQSGKLGPIQRIAARAFDTNEFEFARRCDREADRLSTYGTGNRSNVSLHGVPTLSQHGYLLDTECQDSR